MSHGTALARCPCYKFGPFSLHSKVKTTCLFYMMGSSQCKEYRSHAKSHSSTSADCYMVHAIWTTLSCDSKRSQCWCTWDALKGLGSDGNQVQDAASERPEPLMFISCMLPQYILPMVCQCFLVSPLFYSWLIRLWRLRKRSLTDGKYFSVLRSLLHVNPSLCVMLLLSVLGLGPSLLLQGRGASRERGNWAWRRWYVDSTV